MFISRRTLRSIAFYVTLATFVLLLIYLALQGDQGNVVDISRGDRNVYASTQDFGSVVLYEVFKGTIGVPNLSSPFEILPGKKIAELKNPPAKALQPKIEQVAAKSFPGSIISTTAYSNTLFVLDRWNGIYRTPDNLKEDSPVQLTPFFGAHDLAVMPGYSFVSAGENGLYIYQTATPMATMVITGFLNTSGVAEGLWLETKEVSEIRLVSDLQTGQWKELQVKKLLPETVYLADGPNGVVILDVSEPLTPTLTTTINTGGHAYQVAYRENLLYVARGLKGLVVYDVQDPQKWVMVKEWDTKGEARDVAVNDRIIAVADGVGGLLIYRNARNAAGLSAEPVVYKTPGHVTSVELVYNYAIIADGIEGVRVIDLADPDRPVERASVSSPGSYNVRQILSYLGSPKGSTERDKLRRTLSDLRNETLLLIVGTLFFATFFFYITLPVRSIDREQALRYWLQRKRALPLVLENGQIITPRDLDHPGQMRAILLDSASAALSLRPVGERVLGPGMAFLEADEHLARTLDVRPAQILCGPEPGEDPFLGAPFGDVAAVKKYQDVQARRMQTSGLTRDQVEVVPNILVDVRVDGERRQGGSEYGFSADASHLAMAPEVESYEQTLPDMSPALGWHGLVTDLVTRLWLHYLRKFSLQELFTPLEDAQQLFGAQPVSGLGRIQFMMQAHLTQPIVPRLDEKGQPTGRTMRSQEYEDLQRRGLRASRLQIINLRLPEEVGLDYLQSWRQTWPGRVEELLKQNTASEAQVQQEARQQARERFGEIVSRPLSALLLQPRRAERPLSVQEVLASLVRGTLNLKELNEDLRSELNALLAWVEGWRADDG